MNKKKPKIKAEKIKPENKPKAEPKKRTRSFTSTIYGCLTA